MHALVGGLLRGAISPLVARASEFGVGLAKKLVLFIVAGVCFVVVLIALTIAFELWIAKLAGPIVGALAVAGVYLAVGAAAVIVALQPIQKRPIAPSSAAADPVSKDRGAQVDAFTAPLLSLLQRLGLLREQVAVLAGASIAKQLRPVPLVGAAIVAGFLIGRLWKGWSALVSADFITTLLSLVAVSREGAQNAASQDQTT